MGLLRSIVGLALDLMTDPAVEDEHERAADGWTLYHETREALVRVRGELDHENQQKLGYIRLLDETRAILEKERAANAEARKTMDKINAEKAAMIASGVMLPTVLVVDLEAALAQLRDYDESRQLLCKDDPSIPAPVSVKMNPLTSAIQRILDDYNEARALLAKNDPDEPLAKMAKGVLDERDYQESRYRLKAHNFSRMHGAWVAERDVANTLTEFVHEVIAAGVEGADICATSKSKGWDVGPCIHRCRDCTKEVVRLEGASTCTSREPRRTHCVRCNRLFVS